ncbi:MAG: HAD hydrolase-like protein [Veillonellales bacterium]
MRLLFWDIDGTLIRTYQAGLYAFRQAVEEIWGKSVDFGEIRTAGMTDNFISRQVVQAIVKREPAGEEIEALCRRYESFLPEQLAARNGLVLPGVQSILAKLCGRDDYRLLLLTGNSKTGAQIKLDYFGLAKYFDFSCSAFAEQYEDRDEIARNAREIVRTHWGYCPAHQVYVIGDTPHDIRCGKTIGAYTIGIATGGYSLAELSSCSPWWSVETLPAAERFITKISQK